MRRKPLKTEGAHNVGHTAAAKSFNWREFDPAMLDGKDELAVELTAYRDNLDTLLKDCGKYVVIKGSEIVGVYGPTKPPWRQPSASRGPRPRQEDRRRGAGPRDRPRRALMPSHTIDFASGLHGPQTNVGLDVGARQRGGTPCTKRALIDTGSTATAISPSVRAALKPMKIGRARVHLPGLGVVWDDTIFVASSSVAILGEAGDSGWRSSSTNPQPQTLTS